MHKKMSNTRKRFLIYYFIFACIFILTYIPIYSYVHHLTYTNMKKRVSDVLSSGVNAMETAASIVGNTCTAASEDVRFRPLKYLDDWGACSPSELSALVKMLRYSFIPADWIADAGIVRTPSQAIMRNRSFYSDTYYALYPDFLECQGMSYDQWRDFLCAAGTAGQWLPEQVYRSADYTTPYRALTYARLWSFPTQGTASLYFATLNTDQLVSALIDDQALAQGYLRVTDAATGQVLLTRGNDALSPCEVLSLHSDAMKLTFEVGLSRVFLSRQLQPLKSMLAVYVAVLLLIALVLVILFSQRSAAPMQRLLHLLTPPAHDAAPQAGPDEPRGFLPSRLTQDYDAVASTLIELNTQVKASSAAMQQQATRLREYLFDRAVQNTLYSPRGWQDFHQSFPDFPSTFCLALIRPEQKGACAGDALQLHATLPPLIASALSTLYYQQLYFSGTVVLVLRAGIREELDALHQRLLREAGMDCRILLTQTFSGAIYLPTAYEQAQYIDLMTGPARVTTFADIRADELRYESMPLSYSALHEMHEALLSGNDATALLILNDCATVLLRHPDQLMIARHTYSMIAHMLVHLKMEYPDVLFPLVIPSFDAQDLSGLFGQALPNCFHHLSQLLLERQKHEIPLSAQVLQFINGTLFSPDMCVTFIADHFGITKPMLQSIIKEATGTTFSNYVSNQRLEHAYCLLQKSCASVQQIAEACGFSSANTFYKAFHRKYGVAPSAVSTNHPVDTPDDADACPLAEGTAVL